MDFEVDHLQKNINGDREGNNRGQELGTGRLKSTDTDSRRRSIELNRATAEDYEEMTTIFFKKIYHPGPTTTSRQHA